MAHYLESGKLEKDQLQLANVAVHAECHGTLRRQSQVERYIAASDTVNPSLGTEKHFH
jgi:hypothetical protein